MRPAGVGDRDEAPHRLRLARGERGGAAKLGEHHAVERRGLSPARLIAGLRRCLRPARVLTLFWEARILP